MDLKLSLALPEHASTIWDILASAIAKRKREGSEQWQNGYPNLEVIKNDLRQRQGFIFTHNDIIVGYCALSIDDEPNYEQIKGEWKGAGAFIAIHRVAIAQDYLGQGLAYKLMLAIEKYCLSQNVNIIRVDTSSDNEAMLYLFKKLNYLYRGTIKINNSDRLAFEKIL